MVTLNDIKVGKTGNKVDQMVIDTFIRKSPILAILPFDDCISPHGGSTMTYGYRRLLTSPAAEGRAINGDYTASEATKEDKTTSLQIMGGSYQIDRVLDEAAPDEVAFQTEEKIKATVNKFHYMFINGDADTTNEFDGLASAVDGTSTDFDCSSIDASTVTAAVALSVTEKLDEAILAMTEKPDAILGNSKAIIKLKSCARMLGHLTPAEDAFGRPVESYDGVPFIEMGRYYNTALGSDCDVIGIDDASGKTDIYLVKFGQGGVHGVTIRGDKAITSRLPDFSTAGAVKTGDVEFVASIAVKNTRAVARLENIKVQATLSAVGSTLTVVAASNKITVTPSKPKIGNKYYYDLDASEINAPTVNTAINTSVWTALPVNGAVTVNTNEYVAVVEVDSTSLLPINFGTIQYTVD